MLWCVDLCGNTEGVTVYSTAFFFQGRKGRGNDLVHEWVQRLEKYSIGTVGSCVHVLLQFKANRLGMHVHGVYQIIVLYHVAMPIC
jgi:hypothetical protein